ncbi:uncharacterized protein [Arachis hypogaea]|uniref:uncharacterized protein n=1 Tax=Arachis hypogaea TaxID=3818 RepID=UPI003B221239
MSLGGKVLDSVNDGKGPPQFIISGQNYHRIGSLLPDAGPKPKFAQLYIYDTQHEIMHRQRIFGQTSEIDKELIAELLQMIDTHNVIAQSFRRVREFYQCHPSEIFSLKLYSQRKVDRRIYNAPSCDEVAALIVGDFDSSDHGHDIIVRSTGGQLQRIYETHALYWPLQYPLLFPYGEDGYQLNIGYRGEQPGYVPGRRTRVSLREFICFHLQIREHEDRIIHKCRRLFQQFVVNCFTMIESQRLHEIRMKKSTIRGKVLQGIEEAMHRGDDEASSIGTRIIFPFSFTGGRCYMFNRCQDAMTICKHFGYPDLFLTIMFNPNWPEFQRFTERERIPITDRPDISCRVFLAKLKCLLSDLKEGVFFGPLNAVKINDVDIDNRFVVPYNPLLLIKYQAHINLGLCNKSNVIKYLFKYVNKGSDRVTATVGETYDVGESSQVVDEIKQYYDCRYLSPSESMWRIFAYDIHHRWPAVQRFADDVYGLDDGQQAVLGGARGSLRVSVSCTAKEAFCDVVAIWFHRKMSVWEQTWAYLSDDILYRRRHELQYPDLTMSQDELEAFCLLEIEKLLQSNGKSLRNYAGMPYDTVSLTREHDANVSKLNEEQRVVYDKIIDCVSNKRHGFFFVYGFGGTGKTFLYRVLSARLRSEKKMVINVASSGIASLLLPGGKTAHSMFNIPVEPTEDTICRIKKDSPKAEVVRLADLIIWDEAPMTNKLAFEALDRTLQDIMVSVSDRNKDLPFGGKVVVLGGDFRQVLPVIPKGSRAEIVMASINSSVL